MMTATATQKQAQTSGPIDKGKQLLDWRLHVLEQAGYGEYAAEFADSKVDLHVAADLLKNGCPIDTAVDILR
jgi:hypothetical protein